MEKSSPLVQAISEESEIAFKWIIAGFFEAIFIVCWVLIQWLVNEYVISRFKVDGVDFITLIIAQWLFGFATLAPIVLRIIEVTGLLSIHTFKILRKAWRSSE
jgi:uncharacterized membrane protein YfhO